MSSPFIGEVRLVGFNFAPLNWAYCNGQQIAISQNDALFNLIGTTYGGDGQQTMFVAIFYDLFGFLLGGLARLARADQLNRAHGSQSPSVAHDGPALLPFAGAVLEAFAQGGGAVHQSAVLQIFDYGQRRGTR